MDVRVHRTKNSRLTLDIYRKPTHSGRYLQYSSHQPESVKRSVARALFDRVQYVTEVWDKRKEEQRIQDELKGNGFPGRAIALVSRLTKRKQQTRDGQQAAGTRRENLS